MADPMSDRGVFWRPVPEEWTIDRDGWSARRIVGLGQTMLSGNLTAAIAATAPGVSDIGLWEIARRERFTIRISRDQALLVTPAPLNGVDGWRDGYVTTRCDAAYAVFEIAGEKATDIVAEAVSVDLSVPSRSAATLFAGMPVLLYRTAPATVRLHVEAPLATYVWTWLEER